MRKKITGSLDIMTQIAERLERVIELLDKVISLQHQTLLSSKATETVMTLKGIGNGINAEKNKVGPKDIYATLIELFKAMPIIYKTIAILATLAFTLPGGFTIIGVIKSLLHISGGK